MSLPLREGDRVAVRDSPWRVQAVDEIAPGQHLLKLLPASGDGSSPLAVVSPPERVVPLPPEELRFDLAELGPVGPWLWAHRALALTATRDDVLGGARYGRVNLEAYQIAPVLRILAKPRPRLLIADDVGLGKTIEAGLCLLELEYRRRADRVLVVVPPGLIPQWQEELLERFGLAFTVIENATGLAREQTRLPAGVSPWDLPRARIVTSMDYLKKAEVARRALARPWDLIVVDEAHALAESGTPKNPYRTRRTRLGEQLRDRSRGLLLLTATPHNGYPHSFRSLIELVEPTAATLTGANVQPRIERAMVRRMKRQIRRREDGRLVPAFLERTVEPLPVAVDAEAARLFGLISSYCSRTVKEARGEEAELVSFAMQIVKKRAASSRLALARTLEHRLAALKKEQEREERPDRADLRDFQADVPMPDAQAERVARRILRSAIPKDERRRRAEVRKITEIRRLLEVLPGPDPKVGALVDHLRSVLEEDPGAKVIVFTEYLDTLEAIRAGLAAAAEPLAGAYVELRGGLTMRKRQEVQRRFEEPDVRVLLATDAASEGLNLQRACHRLVHFELPWNPNRLEQRNGRIDRYGQTQEPQIRYLYYPSSPEDDVLARLVRKIEEMASSRVSTPDVLGVLSGMGLEEGLAALEPGDEQAKDRLVRDFEDRTQRFVGEVQPFLLSGLGTEREIGEGERALSRAEPLLPDDLELERLLLEVLGPSAFSPDGREGVYRVDVPRAYRGPEVRERYDRATTRRSIAASEPADRLEYLTPVHPLVQAVAAEARRRLLQVFPDERGLPPKRLAARPVPGGHPPAILFTFHGAIRGPEGLIEEQILLVRVDLDGRPLGDVQADLVFLSDGAVPGEVPQAALSVFADRFGTLLEAARQEASRRLRARAREIRGRREAHAEELRRDAGAYTRDRLRELEEEEARTRGQIEETGEVRLWAADDPKRYSVETKRKAVELYYRERMEEIDGYAEVLDPEPPRPVAAMFLVPPNDAITGRRRRTDGVE